MCTPMTQPSKGVWLLGRPHRLSHVCTISGNRYPSQSFCGGSCGSVILKHDCHNHFHITVTWFFSVFYMEKTYMDIVWHVPWHHVTPRSFPRHSSSIKAPLQVCASHIRGLFGGQWATPPRETQQPSELHSLPSPQPYLQLHRSEETQDDWLKCAGMMSK